MTNSTSASTDRPTVAAGDDAPPGSVLAAAWRPAGLIYLAVCLLGLLAGLYPEAVYPPRQPVLAAPLPALQALVTAQTLCILLVHPLILLRRADRGQLGRYGPETVLESLVWLLATTPLYVAAAWLSDATATDVLRSVVFLLCLWPLTWAAGSVLRHRRAARPAVLIGLLAVAALPAGYYILREFLRVFPAEWLWDLAPATYAWQTAGARTADLLPAPAWPLAVWPALAAAIWTAAALRRPPAAP